MFRSVIFCFTIWVLTALLAGFSAGSLSFYYQSWSQGWGGNFLVTFFATLVCSVPAMIIFWLVVLWNRSAEFLFRTSLKAILLLSTVSCVLIFILPLGEPRTHLLGISACIVLSALGSVMMHHHSIVSFENQKNNSHV